MAALAAIGCGLASVSRLARAVAPTPLDPDTLTAALARAADPRAFVRHLSDATADDPRYSWEHGVFAAFLEPGHSLRMARVNEQLTELSALADRGARIPRVCASVATSVGFLCASVSILSHIGDRDAGSPTALFAALDAVSCGMAGMALSAAAHVRAQRSLRSRLQATDRWIARLSALVP